jgi:hypothetical protein
MRTRDLALPAINFDSTKKNGLESPPTLLFSEKRIIARGQSAGNTRGPERPLACENPGLDSVP